MRWLRVIAAAFVLALLAPAYAVQPDEVLPEVTLETRARALSQELRCLVCQNQSIDDSDAPLARDLRMLLRERLKAGDSDREVIDYLVARYGEFVLLRPRFGWHTALLWLMPALLLVFGSAALLLAVRRRRTPSSQQPARLSPDEAARLEQLTNRDSYSS